MPRPGLPNPPSVRRLAVSGAFVVLLFAFLWLRVPSGEAPGGTLQGTAFGTTYTVRWLGPAAETVVRDAVEEVVESVNRSMSTYHEGSELSRLNRLRSTTTVTVSSDLEAVLESAGAIYEMTEGAFDPTVGPLVDAWGFGPSGRVEPPSEAELEAARARVGFAFLDVTDDRVRKTRPDLEIDLSAIAKGYAVDEVSRALARAGVTDHLVEIGGEVRAQGQGVRGVWSIGVERPVPGPTRAIFEVVPLENASLATSGNYRNFVTVDGRRVTHIIDPRSGAPVDHGLGSVSVVHPECVIADALATALYVLGAEAGYAWAESRGIAALFLTPKGEGVERRATTAYRALRAGAEEET